MRNLYCIVEDEATFTEVDLDCVRAIRFSPKEDGNRLVRLLIDGIWIATTMTPDEARELSLAFQYEEGQS